MSLRTFAAAIAFFVACVLVLSSLAVCFLMAFRAGLFFIALLLLLPTGIMVAWATASRVRAPAVYLCSIVSALLFMLFVPRAIALHLIDASAMAVSGGRYCFYQEDIPTGPMASRTILTADVGDLSFLEILHRGSRMYGPPHVVLITADQTWLWSFRARGFVSWQRIDRSGASLALEGSQFIGRPPVDQIARCLQLFEGST